MPSLNEVIAMIGGRGGRYAWNSHKRRLHGTVAQTADDVGFRVIGPHWGYLFVEKDRRRDPSNIMSVAIKVIEDGLQGAGVIPNDGWADVVTIVTHFVVGKSAGIMIFSSTDEIPRQTMRSMWGIFKSAEERA
jgi:hypothetical protein